MSDIHTIRNPIIPGFYPDPSIVRVGDDFYLANSSFELCPGIPVFHSKDLAHWELVSYALTKKNGFHVIALMGSGGIMAPTIRYHDGTFYIVCCNFADKGNFYVTASDPSGPWSRPQWISDMPDLDCSLFFDDDGKAYLVSPGDDPDEDNHRAFFLTPYDLAENHAAGERKKIWNSAMRGAWAPEAPHIYHIGGWYYLLTAEGGTEHFHSVMIARSKTIDGFYEGYRGNPVMTHRNLGWNYPIDNVGHADLVDTPSGNWYAVMLGSRIVDGQHKNLGRETYICPVQWERDWPIFSPGSGKVEWEYPADPVLPWTTYEPEPDRDDFDQDITDGDTDKLRPYWAFWGTPYQDFWRIQNSRLYLSCLRRPVAEQLKGFGMGFTDYRKDHCVSALLRRQTSISFTVSMSMEFHAENKEAAGLLIFQQANHQFRVEQCEENGAQVLKLLLLTTKQKGLPFLPGYEATTTVTTLAGKVLPGSTARVAIVLIAKKQDYSFYYQAYDQDDAMLAASGGGTEPSASSGTSADNEGCSTNAGTFSPMHSPANTAAADGIKLADLVPLYLHADASLINPEEIGGMVGTMIGMYATANGEESRNMAAFDWFEMKEL